MASSLDDITTTAAAERSTHNKNHHKRITSGGGGEEIHLRMAEGQATARASAPAVDYLTASLGQHKGGGRAGAYPADRYGGRRIRCKAALRSSMPNDNGREVCLHCTCFGPFLVTAAADGEIAVSFV